VASLVLGILSFVGCACVTSVPAFITGWIARKQIAASGGQQGGSGFALAGMILGALVTVASILFAILWLILLGGALTLGILTQSPNP